jgi:hypothetical protein
VNGNPASSIVLNVLEGRKGQESEWDIPLREPSHHWAVPLAVMEDGQPRRVGTAFHFSRLGHLFTARHCVDEALHSNDRGTDLARRPRPVQLAGQLIAIRAEDEKRDKVLGLAVQTVTAPEPTDLACLSTITQGRLPQLTLPLSFALPDAGSTVRCFGFPSDASGKLFPDSLHAVEGTVKAYFPPGFSRVYMRGPCFLVDANVPHGMSGGPVVNEQGAVCGVVSAGAEQFMGEPSCLVAPLYPALLIEVALHAVPAANFRINGTRTFLDLCAEGYVTTDGSEDRVHFLNDDQGTEIGPLISKPNSACVYNSFEDYQAGRKSSPLTGPRMRIRRHEDPAPTGEASQS